MTHKEAAIQVVRGLHRGGFAAFLAGGCVRDMLLGRRPKDYDVATEARPEEVIALFKRTIKVGVKFGVVIVLIDRIHVEVATFRTEADYADGRHPEAVTFSTAAEDASRRDFTINGMYFDPVKREVIDYVGGQTDLKRKVVRTIGRPDDRFGEDHLRMLRAIRFSAQLDFAIERATFAAICSNAETIKKISGERISMELEGILLSENRSRGVSMLVESGLAEQIFEGFAESEQAAASAVLRELPKKGNYGLGLAGVFAACETEFAVEKLGILRLSRIQRKHVKFLLTHRGILLNEKMSLAQLKMLYAGRYFEDLYSLEWAIQKAMGRGSEGLAALRALRKRLKALGGVDLQPAPLVDGHDLMRLGAVPGPALGQLAGEVYAAQLEGDVNTAKQAEKWVRRWLREKGSKAQS